MSKEKETARSAVKLASLAHGSRHTQLGPSGGSGQANTSKSSLLWPVACDKSSCVPVSKGLVGDSDEGKYYWRYLL